MTFLLSFSSSVVPSKPKTDLQKPLPTTNTAILHLSIVSESITGREPRPYLAEAAFAKDDEEIKVGGADEILFGNSVDMTGGQRPMFSAVVVGRTASLRLARSLHINSLTLTGIYTL